MGVASAGVYAGLRINALVARVRPAVADWVGTAGGSSFPSGHTTNATLFAAFVCVGHRCPCPRRLASSCGLGWSRRLRRRGGLVAGMAGSALAH